LLELTNTVTTSAIEGFHEGTVGLQLGIAAVAANLHKAIRFSTSKVK